MKKLFILLFLCIFSCSSDTVHYVKFDMDNTNIEFTGLSDVNSEFYSHNFPDYHTPEKIKKNRLKNPHIYTGIIHN